MLLRSRSWLSGSWGVATRCLNTPSRAPASASSKTISHPHSARPRSIAVAWQCLAEWLRGRMICAFALLHGWGNMLCSRLPGKLRVDCLAWCVALPSLSRLAAPWLHPPPPRSVPHPAGPSLFTALSTSPSACYLPNRWRVPANRCSTASSLPLVNPPRDPAPYTSATRVAQGGYPASVSTLPNTCRHTHSGLQPCVCTRNKIDL